MRIFLSGPITGVKDYEKNFKRIEDLLTSQGYTVVNPTTLDHDHGKTYEEYMKRDMQELVYCDAIYQLKGWEDSRGALFEYETALICGITIYKEM